MIREFAPELLLVSYGGDPHYRDPLASLSLSSAGCLALIERVYAMADDLCGGGVAFTLEGGYDIPAQSEMVGGIVGMGRGVDVPLTFTEVRDEDGRGRADVMRALAVQREYWNLA